MLTITTTIERTNGGITINRVTKYKFLFITLLTTRHQLAG